MTNASVLSAARVALEHLCTPPAAGWAANSAGWAPLAGACHRRRFGTDDTSVVATRHRELVDDRLSTARIGVPYDGGSHGLRGASGPAGVRWCWDPPVGALDCGDVLVPQLHDDSILSATALRRMRQARFDDPNADLPVSPITAVRRIAARMCDVRRAPPAGGARRRPLGVGAPRRTRLHDHFMRLSALMLTDATPAAVPGTYADRVVDAGDARLSTGSPSAVMVDLLMRYCFGSDRTDEFGHRSPRTVTEREVEEGSIILATAGTGMTQNAISTMLWKLAAHWDELVTPDGELAVAPGPMIEECLRLATPLMHLRRTAVADTEVGGQLIGAGEKVILWFAAANFDPSAFDRPQVFDPARSPNPHVSFGRGVTSVWARIWPGWRWASCWRWYRG